MTTAVISASSSPMYGRRTARETAAQADWVGVGDQRMRALGCTSTPVESLCSTFEPMTKRSSSSISATSSWTKALNSESSRLP